jgi:hypothetical protein
VSGLQKQRRLLTAKPAELMLFYTGADTKITVLPLAGERFNVRRRLNMPERGMDAGISHRALDFCLGNPGRG